MKKVVIPERQAIHEALRAGRKPLSLRALLDRLAISGTDVEVAFSRRLKAMIRDGEVVCSADGSYTAGEKPRSAANREIDAVIRNFELSETWSAGIMREAGVFADGVPDALLAHREDLRRLPFVTIDGDDAKDFDDAVYCEKDGDQTVLWVAIADVASFVGSGTALDREAAFRGNSVYFPGRVVPMLPPVLSNDLCSLRPEQERLALACRMQLSSTGRLLDYDFQRALIRSHARLTYRELGAFFKRRSSLPQCSAAVRRMLRCAHALYRILLKQRRGRGALDFDTQETYFLFDKAGRPRSLVPFIRNDAHRLIEEFMICANVAAARFLSACDICFPYRVHQGLKDNTLDNLDYFLRDCGFKLAGTTVKDFSRLFGKIKGHEHERIIHGVVLRSFARAVYTPVNTGHFGLALDSYTHFTSPIRRYPDLLVHRAIHRAIGSPAGHEYNEREIRWISEHCSMTEKHADEATRDIAKYLKCVFLEKHVGETFVGIVTAVTSFGLFMELENVYVDGLLHVRQLGGDYYRYDMAGLCLVGERGGDVYRLGDAFDVVVARVNPREREIDLAAADSRPEVIPL